MTLKPEYAILCGNLFSNPITIVGTGTSEIVEDTLYPQNVGQKWEFYITVEGNHFPKNIIDELYQ